MLWNDAAINADRSSFLNVTSQHQGWCWLPDWTLGIVSIAQFNLNAKIIIAFIVKIRMQWSSVAFIGSIVHQSAK